MDANNQARLRRETFGMAYALVTVNQSDRHSLHLSVWEMSVIRDEMFRRNALSCEYQPTVSVRPRLPRAIPAYKLASVEGWRITPREISVSLTAVDMNSAKAADGPLWSRWIQFLTCAQTRGGFTSG